MVFAVNPTVEQTFQQFQENAISPPQSASPIPLAPPQDSDIPQHPAATLPPAQTPLLSSTGTESLPLSSSLSSSSLSSLSSSSPSPSPSSSSSSSVSSSSFSSLSSSSSSFSPLPSSPTSPSTLFASPSRHVDTGAIVGGLVGGVVFLAALTLSLRWFRQRHRAAVNRYNHTESAQAAEVAGHAQPYMQFAPSLAQKPDTRGASLAKGQSTAMPVIRDLPQGDSGFQPGPDMAASANPSFPAVGVENGIQTESRVLRHADSGLRLPDPFVFEVPPSYTSE